MKRVTSLVLSLLLAGCVQQPAMQASTGHPNLIIVRDFSFTAGEVTLDPSFGFSLNRGQAGTPPRERAASVGRAAAFTTADTITQQLANLGYDVAASDASGPDPGGRALIVTGRFLSIDEGHRRRVGAENASVSVDVEIDVQVAGGSPVRITSLQFDSRRVPRSATLSGSDARGANVNAAAVRVGSAIARQVAETAQLNHWPGGTR
ncbi:MAG: DUF4410 domain-containing protein [Alphaproteobacteria bacterium]|nr:DUF4410 domain-containing protein [Alphaproteobacteria bacterium]